MICKLKITKIIGESSQPIKLNLHIKKIASTWINWIKFEVKRNLLILNSAVAFVIILLIFCNLLKIYYKRLFCSIIFLHFVIKGTSATSATFWLKQHYIFVSLFTQNKINTSWCFSKCFYDGSPLNVTLGLSSHSLELPIDVSWWMFVMMWQKKRTKQLCYKKTHIKNYIVWNMCFKRIVLNVSIL